MHSGSCIERKTDDYQTEPENGRGDTGNERDEAKCIHVSDKRKVLHINPENTTP